MALSSLDTKNYEHKANNTTTAITSISTDDIDTEAPLRVGYDYTIKNVFTGLNKIIKAILNKFKKVDEDIAGVSGVFTLGGTNFDETSSSWQSQNYKYEITDLKRPYTRGYFAFICAGSNRFGTSFWSKDIDGGRVKFLSPTNTSGDTRPNYVLFFSNTLQVSEFAISQDKDTLTIEVQIMGYKTNFSGGELQYVLF